MRLFTYLMLSALLYFKPAYSQKSYNFDYVLEYEYEHPTEDGKMHTHTHYRFINSTDNRSTLLVNVADGIVSMRLLLDGGRYYNGTISEEDFLVEAISLRCPSTGVITEPKISNYDVVAKTDTIINAGLYERVELQPSNEKKFKNGELSARKITMDNSLNLKLPVFTQDDTAYLFHKKGEKIPNGFLKESVFTDFDGKVTGTTRLVQYIPLKKIIMVDKNCK